MSGQEKKAAMSAAERNKIIKAMILAGGTSALIGAMSRKEKSKEKRKKLMDPEASSNAIIVPISKRDFVRDLPTPKELAESRGEIAPKPLDKEIAYEAPKDNVELAKELAAAASATPTVITPEDLNARKKEILRGRKFDFFGGQRTKAAEDGGGAKKEGGKPSETKNDSEKKDSDRVVLRSPDGRFASPTDPVAVEQAEKDAGVFDYVMGGISSMFSPIESAGKIWDVATGKPLWIAGGALGSVYMAEKISEAINKRRREKSKARLEKARDKYVSLMEGGDGTEKSAEDEPNSFERPTGLALGTAFFIPAALTALITNRIHENRKADKKKLKEMSDSYPQDPYILYKVIDVPGEEKIAEAMEMPTVMYKTAEGKDIEIGADTALMMIFLKEAMFEAAERAIIEDTERDEVELIKSAQSVTGYTMTAPEDRKEFSDDEINDAVNYAADRMMNEDNKSNLLDFIKTYNGGTQEQQEAAFKKMMPDTIDGIADSAKGLFGKGVIPSDLEAKLKDPRAQAALASHQGLQDYAINNFSNDKNWIDYKNSRIDDYFANSWGLQRGGLLHKIVAWIAKNLGIGDWAFNRNLRNQLGERADSEWSKYVDHLNKVQEQKDQAAEAENVALQQAAEDSRAQEEEWARDDADTYKDTNPGASSMILTDAGKGQKGARPAPNAVPAQQPPSQSGPQIGWGARGTFGQQMDRADAEDKANAASSPQRSPSFSWSGIPKSPFEMNERDQNDLIDDAIRNPIPNQPAATVRTPNQGSASWKILHDLSKKNSEIGGMAKKEIWNQ